MATESTARESAASRQSRVPLAGVGPDQPVRGVFRMGRSFVRLSQRNDPYRIVELVDSSGALRCYGWTAPFVHAAPPPPTLSSALLPTRLLVVVTTPVQPVAPLHHVAAPASVVAPLWHEDVCAT